MSVYLVTGVSGAGKTTLAHALQRRGVAAIDTDADTTLAYFVDTAGAVVDRPPAPDFAWLATHRWVWSPTRLVELLEHHRHDTLFLCGHADNDTEFLERDAGVFLLCLDEITMLRRLADPQRGNDFGAVGDTGEQVRLWRADFQRRMLTLGATPIDASMPVPHVVDLLLAHTTRAD